MVSGKKMFELHDTHGFPFDYAIEELQDNRLSFDVLEWMVAAHKHGWKYGKIMEALCSPFKNLGEPLLELKIKLTQTYLLATDNEDL